MGCGASKSSAAAGVPQKKEEPAKQPSKTEEVSQAPGGAQKSVAESLTTLLARHAEGTPPYKGATAKTTFARLVKRHGLDVGVWTCEVCAWDESDYQVDEVTVMLGGRLKLTGSDGSSRELVKDDVFFLPKGWSGRVDVMQPVSMLYAILSALPEILADGGALSAESCAFATQTHGRPKPTETETDGRYASMLARVEEDEEPPYEGATAKTSFASLLERRGLDVGVRTCEVCGWDESDYKMDEVVVMLRGRLKLTDSDGSSRELVKDDVCVLPKGWSGRFDVLEPVARLSATVTDDSDDMAHGEANLSDEVMKGLLQQLRASALPEGAVKSAIVLGAGASGLHCARLLQSKGVQVTVLEGRDRIGGRLYTDPDGLDMGGHWIHGGGPDADVAGYSAATMGPGQVNPVRLLCEELQRGQTRPSPWWRGPLF